MTSHDPSIDRYGPLISNQKQGKGPFTLFTHTSHDPTLPSHGPTPGTRAPIPSHTTPSLDFDWVDDARHPRAADDVQKISIARACANEWARDEWGGVMMTT